MILGPGGILQGGAESIGGMHPQLGAQAVVEFNAGLGLPAADDAEDFRQGGKGFHDRGGVLGCDEQVQVSDRLAHAAQAAPRDSFHHARDLLQQGKYSFCLRPGLPERCARGAAG